MYAYCIFIRYRNFIMVLIFFFFVVISPFSLRLHICHVLILLPLLSIWQLTVCQVHRYSTPEDGIKRLFYKLRSWLRCILPLKSCRNRLFTSNRSFALRHQRLCIGMSSMISSIIEEVNSRQLIIISGEIGSGKWRYVSSKMNHSFFKNFL